MRGRGSAEVRILLTGLLIAGGYLVSEEIGKRIVGPGAGCIGGFVLGIVGLALFGPGPSTPNS